MTVRALLALLLVVPAAQAYSVLTHEALIDAAWDQGIAPILRQRYPGANAEEIRKARAYAYGGAIIPDLGYYPPASHFFSDLVHYVRSGDFVDAMVSNAHDINEFAFALGALAHWASDNYGHPIGVNRAVPLVYPKMKRKFGDAVTYEDDPGTHLKVEFGFDVTQLAQGNYPQEAYHNFVGFEVSKELLERAFKQTYGLELKDVFLSVDLALGTFRWSVGQLIPSMTRTAWALHKDEIQHAHPGVTRDKFVYALSRSSYEREWGTKYKKPGIVSHILAFLFRIIPKIGPFRALSFRPPGPEAQKLIMASFEQALTRYRSELREVQGAKLPDVENRNFDTGKKAEYGSYRLADKAADKLVRQLAKQKHPPPPELVKALGAFYDGHRSADRKTQAAWNELSLSVR